ncbi:MAG: serine/threonine-protein kinase [Cyanobacteria bacterium J06560_6]
MNSGTNAEGTSNSPLGDRYRVIRELGRGGFGQTYLAEDLNRYHECCVVKEFVPPVEDKATLNKAKELFGREANVLYQLSHKQIPEFRQLLEVESETGGRLFLVQEYVEGQTYRHLLQERQRSDGYFSETEVTQLLYQLLPVLSYIHSLGLIHRDIAPDNIILRQSDGLPVLIDFGSVKELAATVRSELAIEGVGPSVTRIGKVGYVPQDQLSSGSADVTSDLYGLAATLLVLATGKDPQVLHDTYHGSWTGFEMLSPKLGAVLSKMLEPEPTERFQSADEVLEALRGSAAVQSNPAVRGSALYPASGATGMAGGAAAGAIGGLAAGAAMESEFVDAEGMVYDNDPALAAAVPMAPVGMGSRQDEPPIERVSSTYEVDHDDEIDHQQEIEEIVERRDERQALIPLLILLGTLVTLLLFAWLRLGRRPAQVIPAQRSQEAQEVVQSGGFSPEEITRKEEITSRRNALGIGENTFVRLVDQLYYDEYPNLLTSGPNGGRKALTSAPEDEPLRIRWDNLALGLLDTLEGNVSPRSLEGLSGYSERDRDRWQTQVNSANVSTRSLYDITDARFSRLFPNQTGRDFLQQPIGQLYYALANDTAEGIADGTLKETIRFEPGAFRQDIDRRLASGSGRVYTLALTAGQLLRLNLDAPADSTLLSLYLPSATVDDPAVFADSEQTTWSGRVDRTGEYELVVVNRSAQPVDTQLTVSVDNVTSAPVAPEPEALPPVSGEDEDAAAETEGETTDENNADEAPSEDEPGTDESGAEAETDEESTQEN